MDRLSSQIYAAKEVLSKGDAEWTECSRVLEDIAYTIESLGQHESMKQVVLKLLFIADEIGTQLISARSRLVGNVAKVLSRIVIQTKHEFRPLADRILVTLARTAKSSSAAVRNPGSRLFHDITQYSRYDVKLLCRLYISEHSSHERVRLLIVEQMDLILAHWSKAELEPYYQDLLEVLRRGVQDASQNVRSQCRRAYCAFAEVWQERIEELCDHIPGKTRDAFIKNNNHALLTKKLIECDRLHGKEKVSNLQRSMSMAERRAYFRESLRDQSRFEEETKIQVSTPPSLHEHRDKVAPSAPEKSLYGSRRGEQSAPTEQAKPVNGFQLDFSESLLASDQRKNATSTHSPTLKWNGECYIPSTFNRPQEKTLHHQTDAYGVGNETSELNRRFPESKAPASQIPRNPVTGKTGNIPLRAQERMTLFQDEVDERSKRPPFQSEYDTNTMEDPIPPKYPLSPETFVGAVPKFQPAGIEFSRQYPSTKVSSPKAFHKVSNFDHPNDNPDAFSLLENVKHVREGLSNLQGMNTFMKNQTKPIEADEEFKSKVPNKLVERNVPRSKDPDQRSSVRSPEARKPFRRHVLEIPPRKELLRPIRPVETRKEPLGEDGPAILNPSSTKPKAKWTRRLLLTLVVSLSFIFGCSGLLRVGRMLKTSIEYHRMLTGRMEQFESSISESHLAVKKLEENYAMWTEYVHLLAQEDEKDALSHLEKVREDVKKWRLALKQDMVNFRHALAQELGELANVSRDAKIDTNR